ncbi:DNA-binding ferritin-like protein [Bradyrhizobium sp. LM6.10]
MTKADLQSPTDLGANANRDVPAALRALLADVFALYMKTKNFHWHVSGRHFRDYHLLLDEQAEQIFAMTDDIAERGRKIGGTTLRSIGQIAREQRILDNDADYVDPQDMLAELRSDNQQLTRGNAPGPRALRRIRRRRDCKPAGKLDRRDGAADLVPVRDRPRRAEVVSTGYIMRPESAGRSLRRRGSEGDPRFRVLVVDCLRIDRTGGRAGPASCG